MHENPKVFFFVLSVEGLKTMSGFNCCLYPHWGDSPSPFVLVTIVSGIECYGKSKVCHQNKNKGEIFNKSFFSADQSKAEYTLVECRTKVPIKILSSFDGLMNVVQK